MSAPGPNDPIAGVPPVPATGDDAAAATTSSSVIRGGMWSTGARVTSQVMTVVLSVATARFLGAEGLGRQSYIAFVQASLLMLLTSGMGAGLTRYAGELLGMRRPASVRGLLRWAWTVQAGAAALGGLILVGVALSGSEPQAAWALAGVACATAVMASVPGALLAGAQRWRDASIVGLIAVLVVTPTTIVVLSLGGGIVGLFAVEAAVGVLALIATSTLGLRYVRTLPAPTEPERGLHRDVVRYGSVTTLLVLLEVVVWRRSEFFFLQAYSSDVEIALYSVSFAAVAALMLIPETAHVAATPAFATLFGAGEHERIRMGYSRALRLLVLVSLPLAALSLALGPAAIALLYGDEFDGTAPVLRLMLILLPVVALSTVTAALMMALDRLWSYVAVTAAGAVVILALNWLLVPAYDAVGAALANTLGQAAVAVPSVIIANRMVGGGVVWEAWALLRTAVASAAAGLAGWAPVALWGDAAGLAVGLVTGPLVLLLAARVLRILPQGDARWLAGLTLGGRLPAAVARWIRP